MIHERTMEEEEEPNSAETVASIDHLLSKILTLLPIPTLLRFKSVSKHWLSLLSTPLFCHHHHLLRRRAAALLLPSAASGILHCIPFKPTIKSLHLPFKILQSCNGLLLCCQESSQRYYVCNPTTKGCSEVPRQDFRTGFLKRIRGVCLVFDPVKSWDYEVVCVWSVEEVSANSRFQIEIYGSERGSWRLFGDPFAALVDFDNGVYWNGSVHWLGIGNGQSLYFDVARKVLDEMPVLPLRYGWNSRSDYYLGESCGHLHFVEMAGPTVEFSVYEMRRDYSEWFVKYRVDLGPVVAANSEMVLGRINPFGWFSLVFSVCAVVRGDEEEDDSFLVLQTPAKIIRYNLVAKTVESLSEFEGDVVGGSLRYPGIRGFQFIESLCCV